VKAPNAPSIWSSVVGVNASSIIHHLDPVGWTTGKTRGRRNDEYHLSVKVFYLKWREKTKGD